MTKSDAALNLLRAGAVLAGLATALAGIHLGVSTNWRSEVAEHQFHENSMPRSFAGFVALGSLTVLAVSYPIRRSSRVVAPCLVVLAGLGHFVVFSLALSILPEASGRVANVASGVALSSLLALFGLMASVALRASATETAG